MNLLQLSLGANTLEINNYNASRYSRVAFARLRHISGITAEDGSGTDGHYHATINFTSNSAFVKGQNASRAQLRFSNEPFHLGGIMPYATVKGEDWARTEESGGQHYLTAYTDYETGGTLNTGNFKDGDTTLTLPLYVHVYNTADVGLEISSAVNTTGRSVTGANNRPALVKTGTGTLLLSGNTSNAITGESFINQGILALGKTGGAIAISGTITVGDQAGRDILRLDRSEQIANDATVILRGGPPDPSHHLMAEGILQFNGAGGRGLRETFAKLEVNEGRGVIDFAGGSSGHANYLILDDLFISDVTSYYRASKLFIRNWYEGEDYLLVRKTSANLLNSLSRIEFEGYGPAIVRNWNNEFWHVTPAPEPATYGAFLGALGAGLFVWRKRRRKTARRAQPTTAAQRPAQF